MSTTITGDSPHAIALKLFEIIAKSEGKGLYGIAGSNPDREWVLDTYKQCINAVLDVQRYGAYGS